jgi:fumarate reductase subunit C
MHNTWWRQATNNQKYTMAPPEFIYLFYYSVAFISNISCLHKALLRLALNQLQIHNNL